MLAKVKPGPDDGQTLNEFLHSLVAIEVGDAPVLSCYLDARAGTDACLAFVARSAERIRRNLGGAAQFDFDAAVAAVEKTIRTGWDAQVQGLAVFARGPVGGRLLSVLRLAVPVDNALTLYRLPEIAPLLLLREREARFTLLLALDRGVEVLDLDTGLAASRAWIRRRAVNSGVDPETNPGRPRRCRILILDKAVRTLRRVLAGGPRVPLLLAGEADVLAELRGWLPRRLASRVLGRLELPAWQGRADALARARAHVAAIRDQGTGALVAHALRAARRAGAAVTGAGAAEEALHSRRASTLLLAADGAPPAASQWYPRIELAHRAWRQGVTVIAAESAQLCAVGGIACLLRPGPRRGAVVLPARPHQVGLVA